MLMSRDLALSRGADTLGYIVSSAMVGCDPAFMGMGPVPAVRAAIEKVTGVIITVSEEER